MKLPSLFIFLFLICHKREVGQDETIKNMIKFENVLFFDNGKTLKPIIESHFEKINYGQKISDPLFPRKINLALKNNIDSNFTFCGLVPQNIFSYFKSSDSLAFYFLISVRANVKDSIDKVIGSPDYIAELSAGNTTMMNNTLYNWSMNKYEIYLRKCKVYNNREGDQEYYLITVTSIPLNDLFFFSAMVQ